MAHCVGLSVLATFLVLAALQSYDMPSTGALFALCSDVKSIDRLRVQEVLHPCALKKIDDIKLYVISCLDLFTNND